MSPETARADGEEGPRLPIRANKFQTYILVGVGMISLAAAGVAIWYKMTHRNESYGSSSEVLKDKDKNFSLEPPPKPWVRDEDMRAKLGAPYIHVYRRENPEAYIAIGARDFAGSSARPSDLENQMARPLNSLMMEGWRREPLEEKTWMGQECRGYGFRGVLRAGGSVQGEAMSFGYKGVGYWFLAWSGENEVYDGLKGLFTEARRRCKLLELRKDWKERVSPVVPFKGETVPYTILDAEGLWAEETEQQRIKDEDPKADKFLRSKKAKTKDHQSEAELLVLLLDGGGDPLGKARQYVEAQANTMTETRGKNTFTDHPNDALEGDPTPNTVEGNTPFVLLKSVNSLDPTYAWLYAISAIEVDGKTVAVVAKCKWSQRGNFDTKFVQIVKSLKGS
jgi:hypothetical protein